jgi:nucleoid-associated protein YgaU
MQFRSRPPLVQTALSTDHKAPRVSRGPQIVVGPMERAEPPTTLGDYPAGRSGADASGAGDPFSRREAMPKLPTENPFGDAPAAAEPPSRATTFRLHRISDGDTLRALAEQYLGDADRYMEIYQCNRDVLSDPFVLPIGAELRIPPRTADSAAPVPDPPRATTGSRF